MTCMVFVHVDDIPGATRVILDQLEYQLRDQSEAAVALGREPATALRKN